jgi:hypothetical protein
MRAHHAERDAAGGRPDAATSLSGAPVVVQILDNDVAGTYYVNRASVDLRPEIDGISPSRDIRTGAGSAGEVK